MLRSQKASCIAKGIYGNAPLLTHLAYALGWVYRFNQDTLDMGNSPTHMMCML